MIEDKAINPFLVKALLIYFFLFIIHTISVYVPIFGVVVGTLELCVIFYYSINGEMDKFLLSICFIIPTCHEIPFFSLGNKDEVLYSCLHLPFLQGYPFQAALLLPIMMRWKKIVKTDEQINNYPRLLIMRKFMLIFLFIGIFIGVLSILFNDNNIRNISYIHYFANDFMYIGNEILLVLYFIYTISHYNLSHVFFSLISSFLVVVNIMALVFTLIGLHGYYGNVNIIQIPLSFIFSTTIIFLLMKHLKRIPQFVVFITFCLSLFMQFKYENALGGKSWLVLFLVLFTFFLGYVRKIKYGLFLGFTLLLVFFSLNIKNNVETLEDNNGKFSQALQLIQTVSADDLEYLPFSPKVRIEEFINTVIEFSNKPYYLFGKGYAGSISDHRNGFGFFEEGAFNDEEYNNNSFIMLHESLNVLFLKFGILGVLFLLYLIVLSFKNYKHSPLVLIGLIWALFFFNYSLSIALIGIPALITSIYEIDRAKQLVY